MPQNYVLPSPHTAIAATELCYLPPASREILRGPTITTFILVVVVVVMVVMMMMIIIVVVVIIIIIIIVRDPTMIPQRPQRGHIGTPQGLHKDPIGGPQGPHRDPPRGYGGGGGG